MCSLIQSSAIKKVNCHILNYLKTANTKSMHRLTKMTSQLYKRTISIVPADANGKLKSLSNLLGFANPSGQKLWTEKLSHDGKPSIG